MEQSHFGDFPRVKSPHEYFPSFCPKWLKLYKHMLTYIIALLTLVADKLNSMCAHGSKYIGYMKKNKDKVLKINQYQCFYHLQGLQQQKFGKNE